MTAAKQSRVSASSLNAIVAHPLRARCWTILAERVASPNEITAMLGDEPLGNVSYHVKELAKAGVVELVDTRPVRGAIEHFYRAVERPMISDEEAAANSADERAGFAVHICQQVFADATVALDAKTFADRPDHVVARTPVLLDEAGWREVNGAYEELISKVLDAQANSAERMSCEPTAVAIPATTIAMFFEMPMARRPDQSSES